MRGILTQKFFDNAWPYDDISNHDGIISANYEFVEAAKAHGFDLTQELILRRSRDGANYDFCALVPFDTKQQSALGIVSWDGVIPLRRDEVKITELHD